MSCIHFKPIYASTEKLRIAGIPDTSKVTLKEGGQSIVLNNSLDQLYAELVLICRLLP